MVSHLATAASYIYHCMVLNFHTVGEGRPICMLCTCIGSCICCAADQIARSSLGSLERHNYLGPRICRPLTHEKQGVIFHQGGKPCGALLGCGDSPSVYPLTICPVSRTAIIPSFTLIARMLREEFSNRQKRLYENIYI